MAVFAGEDRGEIDRALAAVFFDARFGLGNSRSIAANGFSPATQSLPRAVWSPSCHRSVQRYAGTKNGTRRR